jgi:hypothetical protein
MKTTHRTVSACLAVMFAATLAAYPLSLIGWEIIAGLAFILAIVIAQVAAVSSFIAKLWKGQ